jgi:hypothetical protein
MLPTNYLCSQTDSRTGEFPFAMVRVRISLSPGAQCLISSLLKKAFEPSLASTGRNCSSPKANKTRDSSQLISSK